MAKIRNYSFEYTIPHFKMLPSTPHSSRAQTQSNSQPNTPLSRYLWEVEEALHQVVFSNSVPKVSLQTHCLK